MTEVQPRDVRGEILHPGNVVVYSTEARGKAQLREGVIVSIAYRLGRPGSWRIQIERPPERYYRPAWAQARNESPSRRMVTLAYPKRMRGTDEHAARFWARVEESPQPAQPVAE